MPVRKIENPLEISKVNIAFKTDIISITHGKCEGHLKIEYSSMTCYIEGSGITNSTKMRKYHAQNNISYGLKRNLLASHVIKCAIIILSNNVTKPPTTIST